MTYSSDLKLLSWYLEAGANEAIGDEPINHFKAIIQPPKITQEQRKIPENQSLPEIISLKTELKGRTYNCKCCNKIFDRDINASKNIMLKYLTEKSS